MQRNQANFANSAAAAGAFLEAPTSLFANIFSAINEADKLRWVCIAPYGDWPNSRGMQRIEKADAVRMVNEFNSVLGTPQRMLGLPWYVGHPDHPAFANKYRDTAAKGRIKKLEAREDGLYAGVKLNTTGEQILTNEEFEGHSVNWYLKQDATNKNLWRPFKVKSVGWTNEPNIPVPTMTTANEDDANGKIPMVFANGSELQRAHFSKVAAWRLLANIEMANGDSSGNPFRGNQYTATAEAISSAPVSDEDKGKLSKSFSDSFASNPNFKADRFAEHVASGKQTETGGTDMRRAHFEHIAHVIKSSDMSDGTKSTLANHFAGRLARTNPQFNHAAFVKAASGEGYSFRSRTPLSKLARNPLDDGIAHEPKTSEADSLYAASKHGANERFQSIAQFRLLKV